MNILRLNLANIFIMLFFYSCADYNTRQINKKDEKIYYSSKGFALIYDDSFFDQKIINKKFGKNDLEVMHNILRRSTSVQITNPANSKMLNAKIYTKAKYPKIFNVVISKKMASILELDVNNPYVEIIEIKKNKTFIAKESNTFEEEKNVVEKAPVDEVKIDDLTKSDNSVSKEINKDKKFILVVADFYYENSAYSLKNELVKKTKFNNISIKKINDKKYRLLVGPFENFNALKTTYISLNNLGFENLNINRE